MSDGAFDYSEQKRGFWQRYGFAVGLLGVLAVGGLLLGQMFKRHEGPRTNRSPDIVSIRPLPPPPPTPPPPTPPPVEQKQEMVAQEALTEDDTKPQEAPAADTGPALSTNIVGSGSPDGFGLSAGGGRSGGGGTRSSASRFGWYAAKVVSSVTDALREHPLTRQSAFDLRVRVWADVTGRVTRVKLARSTGDTVVDAAIENEVLRGFQLPEPPPEGMPMPIVMRLSARRPS